MGFARGEVRYASDLMLDDQEREVTVSGFYLDRFEITRGRFSRYAREYDGAPPAPGSGAHPRIPDSGWQDRWDDDLPDDREALLDNVMIDDVSQIENPNHPMDRLSWFVAFAFCIWDGGRLPTEAEWEYAAAGGEDNRRYPWGADASPTALLKGAKPAPVGSNRETRGAFGHDDLAGGVREWVLDGFSERFYLERGSGCRDCANVSTDVSTDGNGHGVRGGSDTTCCAELDTEFRSAARALDVPGALRPGLGARCARDPRD